MMMSAYPTKIFSAGYGSCWSVSFEKVYREKVTALLTQPQSRVRWVGEAASTAPARLPPQADEPHLAETLRASPRSALLCQTRVACADQRSQADYPEHAAPGVSLNVSPESDELPHRPAHARNSPQ